MQNNETLSVTELNRYLAYKFESDLSLQSVNLTGEVSNCKLSNKHYYFSIKDEYSEINAMFFYPLNQSFNKPIKDGMKVIVNGKVNIYQKRGSYAIIINRLQEVGLGILYQRFLELKEKLEGEGLFDSSKKLPLPTYPVCVGVVTALQGEAINDIISTFNRRFPLTKLKIFPALVQGNDCPKDLIRALNEAYQDNELDAIIIGRGGGSFEDLNGFNDEQLARKLYESKIVTISAVGHEGDYTICDFVCHHRAPTPTGAAMLLTKDKNDCMMNVVSNMKRLKSAITNKLTYDFNRYDKLSKSYYLAHFDEELNKTEILLYSLCDSLDKLSPTNIFREQNKVLEGITSRLNSGIRSSIIVNSSNYDNLNNRLKIELVSDFIYNKEKDFNLLVDRSYKSINEYINNCEYSLKSLIDKNIILNPLNIINKGYSVTYKDNHIVSSIKDVELNDNLNIKLKDGNLKVKVLEKK